MAEELSVVLADPGATITTTGTSTMGMFECVDATSGSVTRSAPALTQLGAKFGVKKVDTSANTVTVSYPNYLGTTTTIVLTSAGQAKTLRQATAAGYVVESTEISDAVLASRFVPIPAGIAAGQVSEWNGSAWVAATPGTGGGGGATIDTTGTDIAPLGVQAAGARGLAADAAHVHAMPSHDQINTALAAWSNGGFAIHHVANGTAADDVASVGQLPASLSLSSASGKYVGPPIYIPTTLAQTNGFLYFVPFYMGPAGLTFTQEQVNVTIAGSAGALIRSGIYTDSGSYSAKNLVVDNGTVAATATGVLTWTISQALAANTLYWLACVGQGTPTTVPTITGCVPIGAQFSAAFAGNNAAYVTGVTGALPSTVTPTPFGTGSLVLLHT